MFQARTLVGSSEMPTLSGECLGAGSQNSLNLTKSTVHPSELENVLRNL